MKETGFKTIGFTMRWMTWRALSISPCVTDAVAKINAAETRRCGVKVGIDGYRSPRHHTHV